MKKLFIILLITSSLIYSKVKFGIVQEQAQSAEFHGNTSTAFALLNASPAVINTFGSYKEIKFDWFYKDNKIQDNFAIELQPFWLLLFKHVSYQSYIKLPYLVQRLSDTGLSLGQKKVGDNYHFSSALNVNIYRQANPITDKKLKDQLKSVFTVREKSLMIEMMKKEMMLDMTDDINRKMLLKNDIKDLDNELNQITETERIKSAKIIATYKANNWNKGFINIGGGNIFVYSMINNNFQSLNNNMAFWLHYGVPIKKIGIFSGLHRYYIKGSLCNGVNVRFGSSDLKNVFTEVLHVYYIKDNKIEYDFNIGGTLLIKKKYMLSLGFKFKFNDKIKLIELMPTYNLNLGF